MTDIFSGIAPPQRPLAPYYSPQSKCARNAPDSTVKHSEVNRAFLVAPLARCPSVTKKNVPEAQSTPLPQPPNSPIG